MNANRRKRLKKIHDMLTTAYSELEAVKDEEEESFENIPENLYNSEKYKIAEHTVELLDDAYNYLEEVMQFVEEAFE